MLGFEAGTRCANHGDEKELHVRQQLKFHIGEYGGFYLAPPKAGSVGTVDMDDELSEVILAHIEKYPPVPVEMVDITSGTPDPGKEPKRRRALLLFTDEQGRPIHDQKWSDMFRTWCNTAGWPREATFHSLRHFFATMLIAAGADPTEVQRALRHKLLRTTLETYVHWWPRKQRLRNVVSGALRRAADGLKGAQPQNQDPA
ncbi:tyrosine-type recombinase/integrase [Hamadaea sp. NPDC050747]|uniref:tyrosine-type recombinase/integrase n=1 Tax=Hamadaea sp. NPDC050747 TaxID=3155789 RepID=UPI00340AC62D